MVYMVLSVSLLSVHYVPGMCIVNHEIRPLPCRVSVDGEARERLCENTEPGY